MSDEEFVNKPFESKFGFGEYVETVDEPHAKGYVLGCDKAEDREPLYYVIFSQRDFTAEEWEKFAKYNAPSSAGWYRADELQTLGEVIVKTTKRNELLKKRRS